jgi:hypothetical protein
MLPKPLQEWNNNEKTTTTTKSAVPEKLKKQNV